MERADLPAEPSPERAAAIDLGSNSFHLVVERIDGGQLSIIDKLSERVRLAAGLDLDGNITGEAVQRALACLGRFGQRLDGMQANRVCVAGTNTLRRSRNARPQARERRPPKASGAH